MSNVEIEPNTTEAGADSPTDEASICGMIVGATSGPQLTGDERQFYERHGLAGVTLFRRNVPAQYADLRTLCLDLQALAAEHSPHPMIIAIDQEGGRVRRLASPFPDIGPNLTSFATPPQVEDINKAHNYGVMSGLGLSGLGVNVNFAPVVDIYKDDGDSSIGDRCYSRDPEAVATLARAYCEGLHKGGVASCLKHFPGQGRGRADTHLEGAVIDATEDELIAHDLLPFRELVSDCPLVMISHAVYPALDPDHKASCSKAIISGWLRDRLGFDGVVLSDDVNMKAFDESDALYSQNIVASIKAGVDGILVCEGLDKIKRTIDALGQAIAAGDEELRARVHESASRMAMFRASL